MTHPLASHEHIICAVCRGHAGANGFVRGKSKSPIWACDDPLCISLLKKVHGMTKETLDAYEIKAALIAGQLAGEWLDEIGKTDIATLTSGEWEQFLGMLLIGFQSCMRRMIENGEAPF
jgi:hypothetical protein